MLHVNILTAFKITGLLYALFLFGCVTVGPDTDKQRTTITPLTVTEPGFNLLAGTHIAWYSEGIRFYDDPRIDGAAIKAMIEQSIANTLSRQGHRLSMDAANSDFLLGYAAALESSLNSDAILLRYGLMFGNSFDQPESENEKAAFVLYLLDAKTKRPVWKSLVQGAFDFEDSNVNRAPRIQRIVEKMFSTMRPQQRRVIQ